ncbi:MAG TPA: hypothetical protein VE954_41825 [Oligoflexus sp.]|uniref:hypothetical protein n=1 Tax=Oligoflexus sp. TaxID=1971216 RepID=UPI002D62B896|nr:hypothetical protein [Oligoflexus sp.]HYX39682.1 hypothetical protein [Oligoflexus sp.]
MKKVTAEHFDQMVDEGEGHDKVLTSATKTLTIDLPTWMIAELDMEARRLNVARKALINVWIADRLRANKPAKNSQDAV